MKLIIKSAALAWSLGKKVGDIVDVPDRNGVSTDRFWRNRLKDAQTDGCVEIQQPPVKKEKPKNANSSL